MVFTSTAKYLKPRSLQALVVQLHAHLTGDQFTGFDPAGSEIIVSWRLIMKNFLGSFSPCHCFKKGICQFLTKECAQVLLYYLED